MSDPKTPNDSTRNTPKQGGFDNPIPFVLREEFEAFADHYNENMDNALQTSSNLQEIVYRLMNMTNGARLLISVLLGWNVILTVSVAFLLWEVYF